MALPTTDELVIGRGRVWFSPDVAETAAEMGAMRYIGETSAFNLNIGTEKKDHYSMDDGINQKNKSIIVQYTETLSVTCEYINGDNLAMFLLGTSAIYTTPDAVLENDGAFTEDIPAVKNGGGYLLGATEANPFGHGLLSAVSGDFSVVMGTGSVALVENTDYVVDYNRGFITFIGTKVTDGMAVTITGKVLKSTRQQIISRNNQRTGQLFYEARNPTGPQNDFWFPSVVISPDGDYALKGADWQNLTFSVEVLQPKNTLIHSMYSGNTPKLKE